MVRQRWSLEQIPDLTGKVIIVTGASSGLGFQVARQITLRHGLVVMAGRSDERTLAARDRIIEQTGEPAPQVFRLDLADLESVRQFAGLFLDRYQRLDILVNNAGIMMVPYSKNRQGFESQMAVNHLGHFALTGLLIERLMATSGSRIVNVSSTAHRFGDIDFDDLMYEKGRGFSPYRAYCRSKLSNLLFTFELERRLEKAGADTISLAAHPGLANTHLTRYSSGFARVMRPVFKFTGQTALAGAEPILRAATDPDARGGEYYGPSGFMEQRGRAVIVKPAKRSCDEGTGSRLWQASEKLTGVYYL